MIPRPKRQVREKLYEVIMDWVAHHTDTDDAENDTENILDEIMDPVIYGDEKWTGDYGSDFFSESSLTEY